MVEASGLSQFCLAKAVCPLLYKVVRFFSVSGVSGVTSSCCLLQAVCPLCYWHLAVTLFSAVWPLLEYAESSH